MSLFSPAALAVIVVAVATATASGQATPLRYHFTAGDQWVYETALSTELSEGTEAIVGHLVLTVRSVDNANGQAVLDSRYRSQRTVTHSRPALGPQIEPDMFGVFATGSDGVLTTDDRGHVQSARDGTQVPYLLGLATRLPIEPLPDRAGPDWSAQSPTVVKDVRGGHYRLGGLNSGGPHAHDAVDSRTYHLVGPAGPDGHVTVRTTHSLVTADQVRDQPLLRQTGEGHFEFDPVAGRVTSLVRKQTITVRGYNVTVEVPTTLTLTLLDAAAAGRLLAADDAADAAGRAELDRRMSDMQSRVAAATAAASAAQNALHPGADEGQVERDGDGQRTPLAGGHGGMPFSKTGGGTAPVLGIRYTMGEWLGRACVRQVDPIFDPKDAAGNGGESKAVVARDGYAVAGLVVELSGTDVMGITVIFGQLRDGKVDPTHEYRSGLIAERGTDRKTLGHDGRTVVGLCGRQGMNLDAVGLVMAPK